jgi:hypothetical protein
MARTSFQRKKRRQQRRRWSRYLREKAGKSSKSGTFSTGKIIPHEYRHVSATSGTASLFSPFQQQQENRRFAMYIGLGGLLILILILWLLGVI